MPRDHGLITLASAGMILVQKIAIFPVVSTCHCKVRHVECSSTVSNSRCRYIKNPHLDGGCGFFLSEISLIGLFPRVNNLQAIKNPPFKGRVFQSTYNGPEPAEEVRHSAY